MNGLNYTTAPRRVERAAANLPQGGASPIFQVSGGKCMVEIIGEVDTIIQSGENNMKLTANPSVGADVDLCAQLDIDTDAVGTIYHLTGTLTDALVAATSGASESQVSGIIVAPGTIDLYCSGSKTGKVKWSLFYIPLEAGAVITTV